MKIMFKEKYRAIYDQITPDEQLLADTLALGSDKTTYKTKPGQQTKRIARFVAIPAGALASLFIAFTILVNLSPAFALSLESVPVLGELSAFVSFSLRDTVSFSPSLSEAVENDYLQHIGQEQTIGDITLRIEYVIVDQKQLHVFFTLQSEHYKDLFPADLTLLTANGMPLENTLFSLQDLKLVIGQVKFRKMISGIISLTLPVQKSLTVSFLNAVYMMRLKASMEHRKWKAPNSQTLVMLLCSQHSRSLLLSIPD